MTNGIDQEIWRIYRLITQPFAQSHGNHDEEAIKTATSKYHQRTRQILKNQVSGKNKIHAINIYTIYQTYTPQTYSLSHILKETTKQPPLSAAHMDPPKNKYETPQKIVQNNKRKILWDFSIQIDKQLLANESNIVVLDNKQKS